MPLLFRFELFDLKVAAESVGLPREKWLYRVACQRGKSRETKRADYTGKVACPLPLSCPFFKICTTQFFQLPTFPHFSVYKKDVYTCKCVSRPGSSWRERGKKIFFLRPFSHRERLFSLDDSWNTFARVHYEALSRDLPSLNQRISYSKSFSNLCAVQYPAPLLPTESLSVIGGTGARLFVCPACRSNDSFVSTSPFLVETLLFGLSTT